MSRFMLIGLSCCLAFIFHVSLGLREGDCEVCVGFLTKVQDSLTEGEKASHTKIGTKLKDMCEATKKSDNRFCYYIGGLEDSATSIVSEISKPLAYSLPVDKICERLKKKDAQICDLRYEKTIDLKSVDLKKLKVRDLKKILADWDEVCDGCLEKPDFIRRIEELKPKYVREDL